MKRIQLLLVITIIIGCGLVISRAQYYNYRSKNVVTHNGQQKRYEILSSRNFFDAKYFNHAVNSAQNTKKTANIKAVVVPHHLIAADIIADILARIEKNNINNVVIIGPNHEDKNATTIASAYVEWQTPFGKARTNNELVGKFLVDLNLHNYAEVFSEEHSVGAIIPFIKYYYPKAKILPIIFNSTAGLSDARDVVYWLDKNLDENTLVVFSLDFSHYLTEHEAKAKDEMVKNFILSGDISNIINLNSDYVDSPAALATAVMYADYHNLQINIVDQKNSNDFLERPSVDITTYLSIIFNTF